MKKMFRSTLPLFLLMGILVSSLITAHAESISPRYTGISTLSSAINISSIGGATVARRDF